MLRKMTGLLLSMLVATAAASDPVRAPSPTDASAAQFTPKLRARETSESVLVSAKGRSYRILVSAPSGSPPSQGFPVIYVLDGHAWFGTAVEVARLREYQKLSPAVVVGVGYPSESFFDAKGRSFDFTPPGAADADMADAGITLGGADQFLGFLDETLKPWVRTRYPVDPDAQILFGHSLGGLFALYALFTRPESFDVYLAASPSIAFSDSAVLKQETSFLSKPTRRNVHVLVSVGEFEYPKVSEAQKEDHRRYYAAHPELIPGLTPKEAADALFARRPDDRNSSAVGNAQALVQRLSRRGVPAEFVYFPGEDHGSAAVPALNRGLQFALRELVKH
jgi:uncharacterized protein